MNVINALWPVMVATVIFSVLTFVAGFILAFARRHRSIAASNYLLVGLGVFLLRWISGLIVPAIAARTVGPAGLATVSIWMQLFSALMFAVGLAFLIAAVFADRRPQLSRGSTEDVYLPGDDKTASADANPYAASEAR